MAGQLNADTTGATGAPEAALARFAATVTPAAIPASIRHEAKRSLVNFFATALAGCRDPAVATAAAVFADFDAGGGCTVIGRRREADARHAASLNAMSGNVFDYDDTHAPTIIHPTAPVAPALFAIAQSRRIGGAALLDAFVVGVEVECRLGNAVSPWHYQHGWHITSTCGVFGAAAAVARLLGADPATMSAAFGNAAAQAAGLVEMLGTSAKSLGVGNAASNGLLSALFARRGFGGPAAPIGGTYGFLNAFGQAADASALTDGLGEQWALSLNTYKPYPCGVVLNPVIEACLALHREDGVRWGDVVEVVLTGHPLLRERTDRDWPASGRAAQVNARHAVAIVLSTGRAGLDAFSDAAVTALAAGARDARFAFHDVASCPVDSAAVRVRLRDGRCVHREVAAARGGPRAPLADDDLAGKLRELAAWGGSGCDPEPLLAALWALEEADDAGGVVRLAAGVVPDPVLHHDVDTHHRF